LKIAINSPGGSCYGGIAIANMIKELSRNGHKTTAFVEGLAASIASVIMCACDNVVMGESSLVMIHQCWSIVQGNSTTLRKEADTMDTINDAIISFYRSKFSADDETLKQWMAEETWFSGREAKDFTFACEVLPDESGFSIAAKLKDIDLSKFKHLPKALNMEKEEEMKQANIEEVAEAKTEDVEVTAEETTKEEVVVEEPKDEETAEEPVEETVPKAEVEKRVSGMQSAMAKQMDALKKDYEAKISEFQIQIKTKDEELAKAKAEATRLSECLDSTSRELSEMTSALQEKTNALDALNASVNTPNETTNWKSLKGKEFFDWYRKTYKTNN